METELQISKLLHQSGSQIESFVDGIKAVCEIELAPEGTFERRGRDRFRVTMPVWVTPLSEELVALGTRRKGVTRDVSYSGAGLAVSSSIKSNFLLLELVPRSKEIFAVIAQLAYCRRDGGFFRVGCEFMVCETMYARRQENSRLVPATSLQLNLLDFSPKQEDLLPE